MTQLRIIVFLTVGLRTALICVCAAADLLDESGTFGSRRKEILDSVSATVILDDYLAWRKEHPGEI